MHKWFMFAFASAVSMGAMAQAKMVQRHDDPSREQWRLELRTALQAQRHSERGLLDEKTPAARQLSSQEHAVLRAQLRQQRTDKPASP